MNMKELFDDFKNYVDLMDSEAIKKSISEAVEHTANSQMFDVESVEVDGSCSKSLTQQISAGFISKSTYAFSSVAIEHSQISYDLSYKGGMVA